MFYLCANNAGMVLFFILSVCLLGGMYYLPFRAPAQVGVLAQLKISVHT